MRKKNENQPLQLTVQEQTAFDLANNVNDFYYNELINVLRSKKVSMIYFAIRVLLHFLSKCAFVLMLPRG